MNLHGRIVANIDCSNCVVDKLAYLSTIFWFTASKVDFRHDLIKSGDPVSQLAQNFIGNSIAKICYFFQGDLRIPLLSD